MAASGEVEFESRLEPAMLTRVLTAGTLSSPMVLAIMISGPVFMLGGWLAGSPGFVSYGLTFLAALPGVPLIAFGVAFVSARVASRRRLFEPTTVRADEAGVTFESGTGCSRAEWGSFVRWRRLGGAHLLYTTPRTFVVMNASGLDPEPRAAFEDLMRRHVATGPRR